MCLQSLSYATSVVTSQGFPTLYVRDLAVEFAHFGPWNLQRGTPGAQASLSRELATNWAPITVALFNRVDALRLRDECD